MRPKHRSKLCRYCRCGFTLLRKATKDHVIPKVVMRMGRRIGLHRDVHGNTVSCCKPCNLAKGEMPATVFLANRFDAGALKRERKKWSVICLEVAILLRAVPGEHQADSRCRLIVSEYIKPIPEHFPIGTRPIELKYADGPAPDFVRGQ